MRPSREKKNAEENPVDLSWIPDRAIEEKNEKDGHLRNIVFLILSVENFLPEQR